MLCLLADRKALLLFETFFAKEARNYLELLRKTPRLFLFSGFLGIKVWSKW